MGWWENIKKETEDVVSDIGNAGQKAWEDIDGTTAHKYADKRVKNQGKQDASDIANFKKFQDQDLLNIDQELYTPSYLRNSKGQRNDQEAMLSLFNARKDEILARRRTPGISQTRF